MTQVLEATRQSPTGPFCYTSCPGTLQVLWDLGCPPSLPWWECMAGPDRSKSTSSNRYVANACTSHLIFFREKKSEHHRQVLHSSFYAAGCCVQSHSFPPKHLQFWAQNCSIWRFWKKSKPVTIKKPSLVMYILYIHTYMFLSLERKLYALAVAFSFSTTFSVFINYKFSTWQMCAATLPWLCSWEGTAGMDGSKSCLQLVGPPDHPNGTQGKTSSKFSK